MDNIILIGHHKTIEIHSDEKYLDGELVPGGVIGEIKGISNRMSPKFLKNFEAGQYTVQDQVFYSEDYINIEEGLYTFIENRDGKQIKYMIDNIINWDDSILNKYLLKRCLDGQ